MGTLSGNRIKQTYQGLLKTSDAAALTSALKVIEDGTGVASALSLSTAEVKVDALKIGSGPTSLTTATDTNVLTISNDGTITKRAFPANNTVTTTTGITGSSPFITIAQSAGTSKTVKFSGGAGITLSHNSGTDTITVTADSAAPSVTSLSVGGVGISASAGSNVYLLDCDSIASSGTPKIFLPAITGVGDNLKFIVDIESNATMEIQSSGDDRFYGKVTLDKLDGSARAIQSISESTSVNSTITAIELGRLSNTTGCKIGDVIECIAKDTNSWLVTAHLTTTGSATSCATLKTGT